MDSSQHVGTVSTSSPWKQPLAFGILMLAPLLVGGFRMAFDSMQPAASHTANDFILTNAVTPNAAATISQPFEPVDEPTLFVAAFSDTATLVAQADTKKKDEKEDEDKKKGDQERADEEKAAKADSKDKDENKESEKSDSKESESKKTDSKEPDKKANDDPACCDAPSEFSEWTTNLDDDIRKAVIAAITEKLSNATENLDKQQERLERLQVETELYKLQIQHLRNRLKEWDDDED